MLVSPPLPSPPIIVCNRDASRIMPGMPAVCRLSSVVHRGVAATVLHSRQAGAYVMTDEADELDFVACERTPKGIPPQAIVTSAHPVEAYSPAGTAANPPQEKVSRTMRLKSLAT